jgi:uncharacterized protein
MLSNGPLYSREEETALIYNVSLHEFLEQQIFTDIKEATKDAPKDCEGCRYKNVCFGGDPLHRYSNELKFFRKSIYCEALFMLYSHVEAFLKKQGVSLDRINATLQV